MAWVCSGLTSVIHWPAVNALAGSRLHACEARPLTLQERHDEPNQPLIEVMPRTLSQLLENPGSPVGHTQRAEYLLGVSDHEQDFGKSIHSTMLAVQTFVEDPRNAFLLSNSFQFTPSLGGL